MAAIGGFRSDLSITRKTDGNFGNVSAGVLFSKVASQVAQARYMSSSMLTFALLRDSSDLHVYKDLYGERNKLEKNEKLPLNYIKNRSPEFQRRFLCAVCDFLTDLERFSVV